MLNNTDGRNCSPSAQVSSWTLNEYFGTKQMSLWDCAMRASNQDWMIKKKLSKADIADKKKAYDVARFACSIQIEEVFDFKLQFDNWTFKMNESHPLAKKWAAQRAKIVFVVPKSRLGVAASDRHCRKVRSVWCEDAGRFFWAKPGQATFQGTRSDLQNQYLLAIAQVGDCPDRIDTARYPGVTIGRALIMLTSVLDISMFKARVKALTTNKERFQVGDLVGNIKCQELSRGMKHPEDDVRERPEQPKGSGSVANLSPNEQYLVVRVSKCENLPAADEGGTSDPYLRIGFDGMVQFYVVRIHMLSFYLCGNHAELVESGCLCRVGEGGTVSYVIASWGRIAASWDVEWQRVEGNGNEFRPHTIGTPTFIRTT